MAWHSEGTKQGLALRLQSSKAVPKPVAGGTCFPLPCPPTAKQYSACSSLLRLRKRLLICLKSRVCLSGELNQGTPRDHQLFLKDLSPLPDVWLINGRACSIYPCSMHTGFGGSFTGRLWFWRPLAAPQHLHSCLPHVPAQMYVSMTSPVQHMQTHSHVPSCVLVCTCRRVTLTPTWPISLSVFPPWGLFLITPRPFDMLLSSKVSLRQMLGC